VIGKPALPLHPAHFGLVDRAALVQDERGFPPGAVTKAKSSASVSAEVKTRIRLESSRPIRRISSKSLNSKMLADTWLPASVSKCFLQTGRQPAVSRQMLRDKCFATAVSRQPLRAAGTPKDEPQLIGSRFHLERPYPRGTHLVNFQLLREHLALT
jgi:hypothetical protein